jgi:anti-sigma factor RsiW
MKNFRDIENLSAYLDGQLSASDAARLEARLKTDPELASALRDLSAARNILQKLPARKAPRNFTLTRKMVGLNPPMPGSYPLFRFATVFAAILFMCSFTANTLTPFFSFGFGGAAAPAALGMGGGGCEEPCGESAMEEPAATEEAFMQAAEPVATEEAAPMDAAPMATETTRIAETPAAKEGEPEAAAQDQAAETANQAPAEEEAPAPFNWTLLFLFISIASGVVLWAMRQTAKRKWR